MKPSIIDLERAATGPGGLFYGVYPALVISTQDPKRLGQVQVRVPMLGSDAEADDLWARVAVPMAGHNRGTFFLPEVDDEVLVAFEGGNPHRPYIVGALWNGHDTPPVAANEDNDIKAIVSRTGIRLTLDDSNDGSQLRLETPGGRTIILNDGGQTVTISDAQGNEITLATNGVTINSSANVTVNASTVQISAGMVDVAAGMAKFSGVVQCDTLIANSVVSSSYTPGAGNVW